MHPTPLLVRVQRSWLLAILFLVPLSLHYLTKEPFAISYLNLLSVVFIGLGILNLLFGWLPYRPLRHRPFVILILIMFVALVWALFFTHPLRNGIGLWTSRFLQPLLVGFFTFQLLENDELTIDQCVKSVFWSLVPLIIMGGLQYSGVIEYRDPGRITATYFYPNTFARYVEILLLVSLPWILFRVKAWRPMYLGIWLLGVVLLLSSKSYNGTVSFGLGLFMMFALLPASFTLLKRVIMSGLIVIGILLAMSAPKLPKWHTSITDSRLTRLEFWHVAGKVLSEDGHFITGIGIKTWEQRYPTYVAQYAPFPPRNWGSVQPHNVFLDSLLKAGLPGLFAVTALLIWPITEGYALLKTFRRPGYAWWFGVSMVGYGVAMLVFGLIDDPIWSDDTMPILWVLLFLLAYASKKKTLPAA